jgi:hypothetical protein
MKLASSSVAWLFAFGLTFVACTTNALGPTGGTFACGQKSSCANQPSPTQADIDSCNQALRGSCSTQAEALDSCKATNEKCKPDGTTDDQATNDACQSQLDDFLQCSSSDASAE